MKFPIIEFRDEGFFILYSFSGEVLGTKCIKPFNLYRNLTRYVVDSNGWVWSFCHKSHNFVGIRKAISYLFNISSDFYSIEVVEAQNVAWFKNLLIEYACSNNPDVVDMAVSMTNDLMGVDDNSVLKSSISLLNL